MAKRQPKLNLIFDPPIENVDYLKEVLKVLELNYPDLKWNSGEPVISSESRSSSMEIFNMLESGEIEPIYFLTIGYFSGRPDRLTYSEGEDSIEEHENEGFTNFKDGYDWVENHQSDLSHDQIDDFLRSLGEGEIRSLIKKILKESI